jgi:hypothetical protein
MGVSLLRRLQFKIKAKANHINTDNGVGEKIPSKSDNDYKRIKGEL